ncbi:hypothetical protein QTN25_005916 [Entamoeba marina]
MSLFVLYLLSCHILTLLVHFLSVFIAMSSPSQKTYGHLLKKSTQNQKQYFDSADWSLNNNSSPIPASDGQFEIDCIVKQPPAPSKFQTNPELIV